MRTDLTVSQVRRVLDLASKSGPITSASIKGDDKAVLLVDFTTDVGAATLVPARALRLLRHLALRGGAPAPSDVPVSPG